jgi:hypothetical protein
MLKDYGEKTSKVLEYTGMVNHNVDPVTAAISVFGGLRKLQRNLELYIEQRTFNHFETRISRKFEDTGFQVRSLSPAQADAVKADYLAASGRSEEARVLSRSIAQQDDVSAPASQALVPPAAPTQVENKLRNEASERATEMVDNLQRFTATEQIEHTEFKKEW